MHGGKQGRMSIRPMILALCAALAVLPIRAQADAWQPSPGHTQIPIWPSTSPGGRAASSAETTGVVNGSKVAGRPWHFVTNVSVPTLTVYSPKGRNIGAAVIVFPGGGYRVLAIDLEGTEVCDWLTSRGITCAGRDLAPHDRHGRAVAAAKSHRRSAVEADLLRRSATSERDYLAERLLGSSAGLT